jgi:cytochrome c-type biogenesis protein CcmE
VSRRTRNRVYLGVISLTAVGLLLGGAMRGALTYYRTPAEVLAPGAAEARTRVGGTVVPGSVQRQGDRVRFQLAAGGLALTVDGADLPATSFREGQDAVVEGILDRNGVFQADQVLVRHGNEYRADPAAAG